MVVATICNHKGGTGKTTTALCLAAALGLSGHRVLLVDLDPQAFLSGTLGVADPPAERSALMFFEEEASFDALVPYPMNSFDLLPAHGRMTRRMRDLNQPLDALWVKEIVQERATGYDLLLFDTAAAVTVFSLNALTASRHVLIPVLPEYQSVQGAEQTFQTARMVRSRLNPRLQAPLFLRTQVDGRKNAHARYQRYLRQKYGRQVLDSKIRTSAALAETPKDGTTVFDFAPHARGARDYANAADEWLSRIAAASQDASAPPPEEGRTGGGEETAVHRPPPAA